MLLGFIVFEWGIEANPEKVLVITVGAKLICKHKGLIPDSNIKACQPI